MRSTPRWGRWLQVAGLVILSTALGSCLTYGRPRRGPPSSNAQGGDTRTISGGGDSTGSGGDNRAAGDPTPGDPNGGDAAHPTLHGGFVGGAGSGTAAGMHLQIHFTWHGEVRGNAGGYSLEGWVR